MTSSSISTCVKDSKPLQTVRVIAREVARPVLIFNLSALQLGGIYCVRRVSIYSKYATLQQGEYVGAT